MAAPRKNPPKDAATTIEQLATKGYSIIGIAKNLGVSRETFKRWCDEDDELQEAFEIGRETERQALHALIVQSAAMNKPANVNAFFILKTRHGYRENDSPNTNVNVGIAVAQNVLVIRDFGTDQEWSDKALAQQQKLVLDAAHTPLEEKASTAPLIDAVASFAPVIEPAPIAPSWIAPVAAVPYFGPPVFNWKAKPVGTPTSAPDPIRSAPVAPVAAPVWRSRA